MRAVKRLNVRPLDQGSKTVAFPGIFRVDRLESQYREKSINISQTYSQLSTVIRQYLQAQWSVPATSQSSQELWHDLKQASCPESAVAGLKQFMSEADELKFSGTLRLDSAHASSPFDAVRAIIRESSLDPAATGKQESM